MQRSRKWIWSVVGFGLLALAPARLANPELRGEQLEGPTPMLDPHGCGARQLTGVNAGAPPAGIALETQSMTANGWCDGGPRKCPGMSV
jgi:hypothetical protein